MPARHAKTGKVFGGALRATGHPPIESTLFEQQNETLVTSRTSVPGAPELRREVLTPERIGFCEHRRRPKDST